MRWNVDFLSVWWWRKERKDFHGKMVTASYDGIVTVHQNAFHSLSFASVNYLWRRKEGSGTEQKEEKSFYFSKTDKMRMRDGNSQMNLDFS